MFSMNGKDKGALSYEVYATGEFGLKLQCGAPLAVSNVAKFTLTSGTILSARTRFILHRRNRRLLIHG